MRYFRITMNALDPIVQAGPNGDSVLVRLPLRLTGQMLYAIFKDGGYVRVPDAEMGLVGAAFDTMFLGEPPMPAYRMLQDSALPEGATDADIPLWSAQAVALVEPPAAMPAPTVWPVLNVAVQPG